MLLIRFMRTLSIYPKLVMAFLLVIIPLYLWGLVMNQSGQEVVQKQISESMASRVHFYLTSLETELTRLTRLKLEYVNDDDLLLLATVPNQLNDYERTRALLSAKSKLYLLKAPARSWRTLSCIFLPWTEASMPTISTVRCRLKNWRAF